MISRRLLITSSALLASTASLAKAESSFIPKSTDVQQVVKDPNRYHKSLLDFDLLRILLISNLWNEKGPPPPDDVKNFLELRRRFDDPAYWKALNSEVFAPGAANRIDDAGKLAQPVAQQIESFLDKRGVAKDKQTSRDAIRGYYLFVQMKAVADRNVERWYCSVYPLSLFCSAR